MNFKKMIGLLLVFMMIVSCLSAIADDELRDLFTFVELYTQRKIELEGGVRKTTYGSISDDYFNVGRMNFSTGEDTLQASCMAGTLTFRTTDFKIVEWQDIFMYMDNSNDAAKQLKAAIAISALEYGALDESIMLLTGEMPLRKAYDIVIKAMTMMLDKSQLQLLKNGQRVAFYHGRYDYSIEYYNAGTKEMIMIFATTDK